MTAHSQETMLYSNHGASHAQEAERTEAAKTSRSDRSASFGRILESVRTWLADRAPFEPPLE